MVIRNHCFSAGEVGRGQRACIAASSWRPPSLGSRKVSVGRVGPHYLMGAL